MGYALINGSDKHFINRAAWNEGPYFLVCGSHGVLSGYRVGPLWDHSWTKESNIFAWLADGIAFLCCKGLHGHWEWAGGEHLMAFKFCPVCSR